MSWLYWNLTTEVKINNSTSGDVEIKKDVRKGCVLSPSLFSAHAETVFEEELSEKDVGIKVNGVTVHNLRYADDKQQQIAKTNSKK